MGSHLAVRRDRDCVRRRGNGSRQRNVALVDGDRKSAQQLRSDHRALGLWWLGRLRIPAQDRP